MWGTRKQYTVYLALFSYEKRVVSFRIVLAEHKKIHLPVLGLGSSEVYAARKASFGSFVCGVYGVWQASHFNGLRPHKRQPLLSTYCHKIHIREL